MVWSTLKTCVCLCVWVWSYITCFTEKRNDDEEGSSLSTKQAFFAVAYPGPRDPLTLMSKSVIP